MTNLRARPFNLSAVLAATSSGLLMLGCSGIIDTGSDSKKSTQGAEVHTLAGQATLVLPPLDRDGLRAANAVAMKGEALTFAEPTEVSISPANAGVWDEPKPGMLRWKFTIERARSVSLNFGFTQYRLPAGAKLRVLDFKGNEALSFTDRHNKDHGQLWTPVIAGERATIELTVPERAASFAKLQLSSINAAFLAPEELFSGRCNVDVVCSQGDEWRDEIRSVAVISTGGATFCTGTLLTDTAGDLRPFFLTAYHCRVRANNAPSLVTYWNFETSTCGGTPDGRLTQFSTGAIYRAGRAESDFTLVELDDPPNPEHNVHWSGWDARPDVPAGAVAIHHPGTDEKRISFENDPLSISSYGGEDSPGDGTHLRINDWDVGTTEPGSSGSGIWSPDHRLVGQLHGGGAACGNNEPDYYGRLHTSWATGTTPDTRLSDWLDPSGTGQQYADGRNQCPRPTVDFTTSPNPADVGQAVTASATVSGGAPPYSYQWDFNGDGQSDCDSSSCSYSYGGEFNANVRLTVTDSTGCPSVSSHAQLVTDPSLCTNELAATDLPIAIPDNQAQGIMSSLVVNGSGTLGLAPRIAMRIEHSYIGDLRVVLVSPTGKQVVLHNQEGGSAHDIVWTDLAVDAMLGEPIAGTWQVRVSDHAGADTGNLVSWSLKIRTPCGGQ